MFELRKFVAPEFVFGVGAIDLAGQYAKNFGARRALVVTDPKVMAAGWTRQVTGTLAGCQVETQIFSGVSPNPRAREVMAGADRFKEEGCDLIVAVGGGSPMDCAKGIGIVCTNRKDVLAFEGIDNVDVPGPPMICVPTTAGSSADVSQFAIINNIADQVKIAIISKTMVPDVALVDPATTTTMDAHLTACTGMDAMVHAIEAFVSSANSPITDIHALEAVRLIHENLLDAIARPKDLALRDRLMQASLQAGLAFSNASLGAVHAMAHSLGGFLDLPHGECNSLLLDHVMAFNYDRAAERYHRIGGAMGIDFAGKTGREKKEALLAEVGRMKAAAGILGGLKERGVKSTDLPLLSRKALKDPCMVTNPRKPDQRDIEVVYEAAL